MAVSHSQDPPSKPNSKTQTQETEMEKTSPDSAPQPSLFTSCSSPSNHTQSPGVSNVPGPISYSENISGCHQCRQRTTNFKANCKNSRNNKPCPIKFCKKCLLNRYGEIAEEVVLLDDWKCPKCRGICNCSCCMKRKGNQPTGPLAHTAKVSGFSSVSEMLIAKGPENLSSLKVGKDVAASLKNLSASSKELVVDLPIKSGKEDSSIGKCDSNLKPESLTSEGHEKKTGLGKRKNIVKNDNKEDGAQSKKISKNKKSQIFEDIASNPKKKEEERIVGSDNGGISEIMSSKKSQIPDESTPNLIKKELKIAEGNDDGLLEDMDPQMQNSDKIYLEPMKKEEKIDENDSSFQVCDDKKMPDCESTGNGEAKLEARPAFRLPVPLPRGIDLTSVVGITLPAEDVGHALQFLEFCKAFGQVFDLKKGLPESVLRELTRGCFRCRGQYSSVVQIHVQLLSLIQKDSREEYLLLSPTSSETSWLQALGKCISKSQCPLEDLPSNCFDSSGDGYDMLDPSKKLRVLNFLCDEALSTLDLRCWIDKQNSKFVEREKEVKEKVHAANDKEKCLKQKMKDEMAKAVLKNGAPLSISEHDNLVSKMKIEVAEAHAELLEARDMATKNKARSDAIRTEPIYFNGDGKKFWSLNGYSDEPHILLQDIGSWDSVSPQEKWVSYDFEQMKVVQKYISCRGKRRK